MDASLEQLQSLQKAFAELSLDEKQRLLFSEHFESLEKALRLTAFKADRALKEKNAFHMLLNQLSKDLSSKIDESESKGKILEEALNQLKTSSDELMAKNEQLKIAEKEAQAANLAKSQFLANMSHELRTPMNGAFGMIQLLETTPLSKKQKHFVNSIRECGESLMNLIEPILDLSKIEANKMELECRSFNLGGELKRILELFEPIANDAAIDLQLELIPETNPMIVGDQYRLRQVLNNLLNNAVKFSNGGKVTLQVEVKANSSNSTQVYFAVRDNGIGIPSDRREALFESFNQADNSITRKFGGTGLGLSVSQHLVSLMGGNIEVESKLGEGSCFFFTLEFTAV